MVHSLFSTNVPGGQVVHSSAPTSDTDAGPQSVHSTWPSWFWEVPAGHRSHSSAPETAEYEPTGQLVQLLAPVWLLAVPGGQLSQEVEP